MNKKFKTIAICGLVVLAAGCTRTATLGSDVYERGQAKTAQNVQYGVITANRIISIQADSNDTGINLGSIGGASLGAIAASHIGGGMGSVASAIIGGLAGGVLGDKVQENVAQIKANELAIKINGTNKEIVVVQKYSDNYYVGQKVRLIGSNNNLSVSPVN